MSLAQTALSAGLVRLTELLPTTFTVGNTEFNGLLSEAKTESPTGGKAVASGDVYMNEITLKATETAYTSGAIKDGATITSNGGRMTVVGRPRIYGSHMVKITVRQNK